MGVGCKVLVKLYGQSKEKSSNCTSSSLEYSMANCFFRWDGESRNNLQWMAARAALWHNWQNNWLLFCWCTRIGLRMPSFWDCLYTWSDTVTIHKVRTIVLDYGELLAYWFILHACSMLDWGLRPVLFHKSNHHSLWGTVHMYLNPLLVPAQGALVVVAWQGLVVPLLPPICLNWFVLKRVKL